MQEMLNSSVDPRTTEAEEAADDEFRRPSKRKRKWTDVEELVSRWNITSASIDRTSRRAFPVCFLVFNIIYWLTYLAFAG